MKNVYSTSYLTTHLPHLIKRMQAYGMDHIRLTFDGDLTDAVIVLRPLASAGSTTGASPAAYGRVYAPPDTEQGELQEHELDLETEEALEEALHAASGLHKAAPGCHE